MEGEFPTAVVLQTKTWVSEQPLYDQSYTITDTVDVLAGIKASGTYNKLLCMMKPKPEQIEPRSEIYYRPDDVEVTSI